MGPDVGESINTSDNQFSSTVDGKISAIKIQHKSDEGKEDDKLCENLPNRMFKQQNP